MVVFYFPPTYINLCTFGSVYVVFEKEDAKAHCLQALNRANTVLSNLIHGAVHRLRFRGLHCLNVEESSGQCNVLWQNQAIGDLERFCRRLLTCLIVLVILAGCFLWIDYIGYDRTLLLISIIVMDICLPVVMRYITMLEGSEDEEDRQHSLMIKLFCSRILIVVLFPFFIIPWGEKINPANIAFISNLQLVSCFVSPIVKLLDPVGTVYRYVFTPLFAKTQADANRYWFGTPFTLAERYTELSQIMFISLFYSALVPSALFVGGLAFLNLFVIDKYILLRNASPPPKLDNSMGLTVSKQLAFGLLCKMLVTVMFVYSWPMDEVYRNSEGDFEKVDKNANILPLWRFRQKEWQSHAQWQSVLYYIYAFYACLGYCLVVFLIGAIKNVVASMTAPSIQCSNQTPYSAVESIMTYCPVIRYGPESFVAADTRHMLRRHRPDTLDLYDAAGEDKEFNLADYLTDKMVQKHMSLVKWYGRDDLFGANEEPVSSANIDGIDLELGTTVDLVKRMGVQKGKASPKQVVPVPEPAQTEKYIPIVSFTSEERAVLKKVG